MTISTTTNLGLKKADDATTVPDAFDAVNDNMDALDAAIGAVDAANDGSLQEQVTALGESVSQFDLLAVTSVRFGCFSNGTASLEFFMPEGSGIYCYALIIQTASGQQLQWRKYTSATSYTVLWTK